MADPEFAFARQSLATMNLGRFLTHAAARKPDHPAIIFRDQTISYGALNARTDALAHALVALGIGPKDRVLIHSNNHPDMVAAIYAIWKTGAVIVPTNFRAAPDDIVKMAHAAGASAFIGNEAFGDHLAAMESDGCCAAATLTINGSLDAAIAGHAGDGPFQDAAVLRDDPAWFFFTSGTTGFPKCAVLTHGQMGFVLNNHVADLMPGLSARDASLVIAPLSHGA
ncbi:MAG: AMP-binding protein, partial [Ahrensia sp.]